MGGGLSGKGRFSVGRWSLMGNFLEGSVKRRFRIETDLIDDFQNGEFSIVRIFQDFLGLVYSIFVYKIKEVFAQMMVD